MEAIIFEEKQYFRTRWQIWVLFFIPMSIPLVAMIYIFLSEKKHSEDIIASIVMFILLFVLFLFFFLTKLTVQVSKEGLRIQYFPLRKRFIPVEDIQSYEARHFSPLFEYGGWGLRYGGKKKGWLYNLGGNEGMFIILKNDKRIMIGTKRPEELYSAIQHVMKGKNLIKKLGFSHDREKSLKF